ncbi:hypothetical protein JIG36_09850 [Actinoplanes sp. LDG1-06]|uniref:Uncharacterized protein n=1 Tax=Paractinoplanes ovalisporus TaxID=2810368 RepID=A0ABS2A7N8_9ACTN|nr:hypothetical protein [Actinoplanes ovalisporus]MBM2615858.1 hypothetical protein [Actinoplanes ovalisporus]
MIQWLPASSSLNFLAGIFAGAGINLITSVATGPEGGVSSGKLALDSVFWVLAAAFLTWAAQVIQRGEREADRTIAPDFSDDEEREVRQVLQRRSVRRARWPLVYTAVSLAGAIALLPRFIHWSALF